jgi:hypothetical protein
MQAGEAAICLATAALVLARMAVLVGCGKQPWWLCAGRMLQRLAQLRVHIAQQLTVDWFCI